MDNKFENFSKKLTRWIGSSKSIVIHTMVFIGSFAAVSFDFISFDRMLLILTTVVSLEAIYLFIFRKMTVNQQAKELEEVSEDIEDIQGNVEGIQEDVDEIQKDMDDIQENMEDIHEEVKDMI